MVRVWRVWRRYGRRRSGEGGMDSRDPTHSSGTLAAYETMADQPLQARTTLLRHPDAGGHLSLSVARWVRTVGTISPRTTWRTR